MYRGGGFTPQRGWARVFHARKGRRWEAAFSPPQICRPLSREPLLGTGRRATQADPGRRPPGALARAGHGRQRAPARPLSARLPPTPHPVPHPAPRQPGGGVSQGRQRRRWWRQRRRLRLAPGRGGGRGGGEEGKTPARPALPSGPREGAAGTRHSLPGDARGGAGRGAELLPWLGGAPPAAPRGGRANQATPPPSPGPHDSAQGAGRRGLGWLLPYRPSTPTLEIPPCFPSPTLLPSPPPAFAEFIARKREQKPGRRGLGREGGNGNRGAMWSQASTP